MRLAAAFLTIFPTLDKRPRASTEVAASFGWFPLIGFAIGGAVALGDWMLTRVMAASLRSLIAVAALALMSGGIHLDGLADTADALAAGSERARALAIMRDSRIGTFGALALIFTIALKVAALAGLRGSRRRAILILAPGWARWAMVAVAQGMNYLRDEGAGTALLQRNDRGVLLVASSIALIGTLALGKWVGLAAPVAAIAATALLRGWYRRWLGGVTGDMLGAAGEIVESVVMLAAVR
jgi:adenosylcobinamide-GDP ribazoletransferase